MKQRHPKVLLSGLAPRHDGDRNGCVQTIIYTYIYIYFSYLYKMYYIYIYIKHGIVYDVIL